jgi:hypothetical protein
VEKGYCQKLNGFVGWKPPNRMSQGQDGGSMLEWLGRAKGMNAEDVEKRLKTLMKLAKDFNAPDGTALALDICVYSEVNRRFHWNWSETDLDFGPDDAE